MAVTTDDVRHVARLARLAIPDAELEVYVAQLNGILGHMEVLQKVASGGAARAADDAREGMRRRPDGPGSVRLDHPREQDAPSMREGFYLVPRLGTHGDTGDDE